MHSAGKTAHSGRWILVMAEPPHPSIADVLEVRIPRPRNKTAIMHDPELQRVYDRLAELLMHQLAPVSEIALQARAARPQGWPILTQSLPTLAGPRWGIGRDT